MDTSACGNLFQYHKQYEGGFFFKLHHNAFQYNFFFICNWAEISFTKWEKWGYDPDCQMYQQVSGIKLLLS
jgi:hypothetical protein